MEYLGHALVVGIGATALMDIWGVVRHPLLGMPRLDYALLGRWIGHMARGHFRHEAIAAATPVRGERLIGWGVHYLIGTAFAAVLLGGWGLEWLQRPTLAPALMVGVATVLAPLLIMQPLMGAGLAGRHTPRPGATRMQALLTHTIYGVGLYLAGWLDHLVLQ